MQLLIDRLGINVWSVFFAFYLCCKKCEESRHPFTIQMAFIRYRKSHEFESLKFADENKLF